MTSLRLGIVSRRFLTRGTEQRPKLIPTASSGNIGCISGKEIDIFSKFQFILYLNYYKPRLSLIHI